MDSQERLKCYRLSEHSTQYIQSYADRLLISNAQALEKIVQQHIKDSEAHPGYIVIRVDEVEELGDLAWDILKATKHYIHKAAILGRLFSKDY